MFEAPTIAGLMDVLAVKRDEKLLAIENCPESKYYHLSRAQKRLWFFQQMAPTSPAYHILMSIHITGFLDVPILKKSLDLLAQRHEMLRTSIMVVSEEESETGQDEFPAQTLHERVDFEILQKDISGLEPEEKERRLYEAIEEIGKEPFDLARAPLFRTALVQLDTPGREHVMIFVKHHIISDAWSINNMVKEFVFLYDRLSRDLPVDMEPLAFQYKDFAYWQNKLLDNRGFGAQEDYWLKKLAGELPVLELYTDFPRRAVQGSLGDKVTFFIDAGLTAKLKILAAREVSTMFMILAAALKVLLYRYTNQEDLIVGTLTAGRPTQELEKIMGYFVNILALRDTVKGEWKFDSFLKSVRKTMLEAYDNQDYPFDRLVDQLKVERNPGRSPVFDIMLAMQAYEDLQLATLETLEIKPLKKNYVVSKYDLYLDIMETPDHITVDFEYSVDLFKRDSIESMVGHYLEILRSVADFPQQTIVQVDMLSETEKKQLIVDFNNTAADYPGEKTIHLLFEEQESKMPDRVGLVGQVGPVSITYRYLNQQSNRLAGLLVEKGVLADTIVGIMMERSVEMIIAIFGILKAGGAYLPIDPEYPQERIQYMLQDSNAKVLINKSEARSTKFETNPNFQNSNDQNKDRNFGAAFVLDFENLNFDIVSDFGFRISDLIPANLAYIIYTSGSTGKPKGVMIQHRSVVNRLNWMQKFYPLNDKSIILQKTPISFDVSVWELFWWSFYGASVCLLGVGEQKNPQAIVSAVEKNGITVMHFVPSMLNVFLDHIDRPGFRSEKLRSLTHVFASGEALSPSHVERFNRLFPQRTGTRLINLYGPTEATVDVSYFEAPGKNLTVVPIGKPIDNIQLHVLDKNQVLLPVGAPGELSISGDGLARGYLNRPELTAEKFIKNRSYGSYKTYINYKTGDLARWLPDGNIEYLGRMDHQVKIRGFRIELGEIENCLLAVGGIKEAVVIVREDDVMGSYLCAYMTVSTPGINIAEVKTILAKKLPEYMIPAHFVTMGTIPLLPNGKLGRKLLPEPGTEELGVRKEFTEPGSKTEKKIADIWSKILKKNNIGIHDNFFELGGHSLVIPRVFNKLDKAFPGKLEIADLFEYLTIYRLARHIDGNEQSGGGDDVIVELSID
jgi:amino acid adenylation domain-containing protein